MEELREEFDNLKKKIEICLGNCDFAGMEKLMEKLMPIGRKLVNAKKLTLQDVEFCEDVLDILQKVDWQNEALLALEEEIE